MKKIYWIFTTLLLSATIAPTITSGARLNPSDSVASDSAVYCYTVGEVRKIAVLIRTGEHQDSLLTVANEEISYLKAINTNCDSITKNLVIKQNSADNLINKLQDENGKLWTEKEKLYKKNKKLKWIKGGSLLANAILLAILII